MFCFILNFRIVKTVLILKFHSFSSAIIAQPEINRVQLHSVKVLFFTFSPIVISRSGALAYFENNKKFIRDLNSVTTRTIYLRNE